MALTGLCAMRNTTGAEINLAAFSDGQHAGLVVMLSSPWKRGIEGIYILDSGGKDILRTRLLRCFN